MADLKIPAFGEECIHAVENRHSEVYFVKNAATELFNSYTELFLKNGFEKKESFERKEHYYIAFSDQSSAYFMNYYPLINELYIVKDNNALYFTHNNIISAEKTVTPQITQIALEDFGLSYAVRLSDGRFIIFDGGWDFEPDADKLFNCLKKGSFNKRPRIAAWILTHAHRDHFECFAGFMNKYSSEVDVDAFYYNFPEHDDIERFPEIATLSANVDFDSSASTYIKKTEEIIKKTSAPTYTPHTGQAYVIGDAVCEVLTCFDDSIPTNNTMNASSLVIRMELGGQVILWAADSAFSVSKIVQKHREYLKSDILQVPHHGFSCGKPEAEIAAYELIKPNVCFIPVSSYNAYTTFSTFKQSSRYLMTNVGVKEIITGTTERTITLPYTAPAYKERELYSEVMKGIDNCGSCTWVFSGLSTSDPDDFVFTFLNMTQHSTATVMIELFFKEKTSRIRYIKAEIESGSIKTLSIIGDEVDPDSVYYNTYSLKKKGIPENETFAVRFISDIPIIISHKTKTAAYHTENRI